MAYKSTIAIVKKITCDCDAYNYPHALGSGLCKSSLSAPVSFSPPKRGLASKLIRFLDDLEISIESLSVDDSSVFRSLLQDIKKDLF